MKPKVRDVINCHSDIFGRITEAEIIYISDTKIHLKTKNGTTYVNRLSSLQRISIVYSPVDDTDLGI